jgi:hypothetical protein
VCAGERERERREREKNMVYVNRKEVITIIFCTAPFKKEK